MTTSHRRGVRAELIAVLYLFFKGYRILKWRYRVPVGEIDILAEKRGALVCVEVKCRARIEDALQAVTPTSRRRIAQAAGVFLSGQPRYFSNPVRFDLIAVQGIRVRHLDNAWNHAT